MAFRKKFSKVIKKTGDRVKKTQLYVSETGKWALNNASGLMDLLSTGVRTCGGSISATNAAVDISHAIEDYACSDSKCLTLDTAATLWDVSSAILCFIPSNRSK